MLWAQKKPTLDESENYVRLSVANWILKKNQKPYLPFLIFSRETNQFVGNVGYLNYNWTIPCTEIGCWVRTSCLKQGFATEAVNALTLYGFKIIGAKRITIHCDSKNVRSTKIAAKLNYTYETTVKFNRVNPDGNIGDTLVFVKYDLTDLPSLEVKW